ELGIRPALCIGVSGGSWNAAAVAVHAEKRLRFYWKSFARMPHFDFRNILREHSPYTFPAMHARTFARYVGGRDRIRAPESLPLFIGVTRLRDHTFEAIDARQVDDPLQLMLASNYVPPFYTHAPRVNGERYGDGGTTNNVPYEKAFAEGCDAVVLINLKGISEGGLYRNPQDFDHEIHSSFRDRVVVIRPRHRVPFGFTESRWSRFQEMIQLGYLRGREVLLGEQHPETDLRARRVSPSIAILRTARRVKAAVGF
ncbi:MAG TPA: patatin-like phospholipase family protein, partial [Thermoanaerobaculia bacterium]|nr:patatin-like phospholipase family protein [Thermoanaerobaculia bacterium]